MLSIVILHPVLLLPLLVALGAVPGALSRYYLTLLSTRLFGTNFPYGTLMVNLSGALLMGFCITLIQTPFMQNTFVASLNPLVTIGFLGSYTTFSTYELDVSNLFRMGRYKQAILYWLGSPFLGFLGVELGIFLAKQL